MMMQIAVHVQKQPGKKQDVLILVSQPTPSPAKYWKHLKLCVIDQGHDASSVGGKDEDYDRDDGGPGTGGHTEGDGEEQEEDDVSEEYGFGSFGDVRLAGAAAAGSGG